MNSSEIVEKIPLEKLKPFPNHPFQVRDDAPMRQLVESIRQVGVLVPIIVRHTEDQSFEIISEHRRTKACEVLAHTTVPAIIRDVDSSEAVIMMVDSNFQREQILPSEKAKAYKMKPISIRPTKCLNHTLLIVSQEDYPRNRESRLEHE